MRPIQSFLLLLLLAVPIAGYAQTRTTPESMKLNVITIRFNDDYLKGCYLLIDSRTPEEKKRNLAEGKLDGPVILFLHGHCQRADDHYSFTSTMAKRSKSGIVMIPVSATPMGRDEKLRGDNGKEIILMEITRQVLAKNGMRIEGYKPLTDLPVTIEEKKKRKKKSDIETGSENPIPVNFAVVGWSHGGVLARRIANKYPETTVAMAQTQPAGYEDWNGFLGISTGFNWECTRIGFHGATRGHPKQVVEAGCGVAKGTFGDLYGSCSSCLFGNFSLLKPFRFARDGGDCGDYQDDNNYPVAHLKHITVIFGEEDSLFEYKNTGLKRSNKKITKETQAAFVKKYYPGAAKNGAQFSLKVLPGNHIGLFVHPDKYIPGILGGIGQLKETEKSSVAKKKKKKKKIEKGQKLAGVPEE
ncbi:MAG: hypothetical protein GY754_20790 [bacterium]|nr:hypothetical protein [bacterium]